MGEAIALGFEQDRVARDPRIARATGQRGGQANGERSRQEDEGEAAQRSDYPVDVPTSPAKRLILLYALLTAVTYPYAAIAGELDYPGFGETVFSLVVYGAIIFGLWRGSGVAWGFAAVLGVLALISLWLVALGFGPTLVVLLGVTLAQLVILFTPSVSAHAF